MRRSLCTGVIILCGLLLIGGVSIAQSVVDETDGAYLRTVAQRRGAALVTVKAVVELAMRGMPQGTRETENETELTGLVVDPSGLVLVSNTMLGGFAGLMSHFMGASGFEIEATPTQLTVLVGSDERELSAHVVARDTELDLAWIQLDVPPSAPLPAVELSDEPSVQVGQLYVVLGRLDKSFGRALTSVSGRIAAVVSKPRRLYVPAAQLGYGTPVFLPDGRMLGFSVLQLTLDDASGPSENPLALMQRSMSMGSRLMPMILPTSRVAKATERARKLAAAPATEPSQPVTDSSSTATD